MADDNVKNFSIHIDFEADSEEASGLIREQIVDQIDHDAIIRSRTSVVKNGPFDHKLGD